MSLIKPVSRIDNFCMGVFVSIDKRDWDKKNMNELEPWRIMNEGDY